jgi:inhibitor of KinA sporulation pathway (predicted exonuclease)
MKDINLLSLDLEMNKPSGSIIQVGCVVGNLASGKILEEYSAYINTGEVIDSYITNLTGIRQEDVDNGVSLFTAYEKLCDLHKKHTCFRNAICWGGGDSLELKKQLHITDDEIFLFGRRWIDVKTLFISYRWANEKGHQAGLAKAMTKLDLQFYGKKHSAVSDSLNTFIIYRKLLEYFKKEQ